MKRIVTNANAHSTHYAQAGEELHIGGVHQALKKEWPTLLTILAPRQTDRSAEIASDLKTDFDLTAVLWSSGGAVKGSSSGSSGSGSPRRGGGSSGVVRAPKLEGVDVLVVDVAADLPLMYW